MFKKIKPYLSGILLIIIGFTMIYISDTRPQNFYRKMQQNYKIEDTEEVVSDNTISDSTTSNNTTSNNNIHLEYSIDYNLLKNNYPNMTGYIYINDTEINYPIMQASDNEYYLYRLPDGSKSTHGSIFMDAANNLDDQYIMIYGHNMKDGTMFADLKKYLNKEFYKTHTKAYIYIDENKKELKVKGVLYTDTINSLYDIAYTNLHPEIFENNFANCKYKEELSQDPVYILSTCYKHTGRIMLFLQ